MMDNLNLTKTSNLFIISAPSGAGKTSLFKAISGLSKIDTGKIKFHKDEVVNLHLDDLFGEIPLPDLIAQDYDRSTIKEDLPTDNLKTLIFNVLNYPVVGSKKFLITIGDRTVNGLVFRDQLIGNRQMPV